MNFTKYLAVFSATILLAFGACKKESDDSNNNNNNNNNPTPTDSIPSNYIKVGEAYMIGASAKAVVYSTKEITVGYNKLYIAMYDSTTNTRLNDGHVEVEGHMEMGSLSHATPVENFEVSTNTDKFWKANVYFIMSGSTGWTLKLHFHNHKNDKEGEGGIAVSVANTTLPVLASFSDSSLSGHTVFLSMIYPQKSSVGVNDFEFTAFEKYNDDSFPAVNDYTVNMTPIMVSMGHSSPNNVNPVSIGEGHYNGDVVFTMSGKWRIYLTMKKNNITLADSLYFDVNF